MNDSNRKRDCELKTNLGGYFKVNSWELGIIREDASRTGTKLLLQKLRSARRVHPHLHGSLCVQHVTSQGLCACGCKEGPPAAFL